jgi:N-acetylmuramoyl-L-alanine amidase
MSALNEPVLLPSLDWIPNCPNESARLWDHPVSLVVVHRPVGSYKGSIAAMMNAAHEASAHVIVRDDGARAAQLVAWNRKAWACRIYNSVSDNIETPDWIWTQNQMTGKLERVMQVCARVVAYRLHKRGLPGHWVRASELGDAPKGFTRHTDLGALGGGHTDPTLHVPRWNLFASMVREELVRGGFRATWGHGD